MKRIQANVFIGTEEDLNTLKEGQVLVLNTPNGLDLKQKKNGEIVEVDNVSTQSGIVDIATMIPTILSISSDESSVVCSEQMNLEVNALIASGALAEGTNQSRLGSVVGALKSMDGTRVVFLWIPSIDSTDPTNLKPMCRAIGFVEKETPNTWEYTSKTLEYGTAT